LRGSISAGSALPLLSNPPCDLGVVIAGCGKVVLQRHWLRGNAMLHAPELRQCFNANVRG
jgi:hypothetical protein